MRIGFVGGGTGGHFNPLLAVAEVLREEHPDVELYYFGPVPYNQAALDVLSIKFIPCPAGKMRRYISIQNFFDFFRSIFGVLCAIWKLYVVYPDVIFSKGSYTSVPVTFAARLLRIPVVIHESDAKPGRANVFAKKFARYIAISHEEAVKYFPPQKTALTGIPLQKHILAINPQPFVTLGIPQDKPLIYVTGGSLGAERINNAILQSLPELLTRYRVFHQVGDKNIETVKAAAVELLQNSPLAQNYFVVGHIPSNTVSLLLDAASVVVSRAGSTTLFEIAHHRKPAITIPIPEEVSHDQRSNAYAYARGGAAVVIEEHNLTPHLLIEEISSIIDDPARYSAMVEAAARQAKSDAATKIARILISISQEHV